ncbi:MAG: glucose-6-phosphate isomerase [Pseudomonadota bacterium]|nr:glucose-6-phosphate isomerase [Pseudomonadota bacterium]
MNLSQTPVPSIPHPDDTQLAEAWRRVVEASKGYAGTTLRSLFAAPDGHTRADRYCVSAAGITLDYSKNWINGPVMDALVGLGHAAEVPASVTAMFEGAPINATESRPALHVALRGSYRDRPGLEVESAVHDTQSRLLGLYQSLERGDRCGFSGRRIRHIVNIGIGGSDLGPRLVTAALRPFHNGRFQCHFLANIDGEDFLQTTQHLDPEETLFVVASKSFGTLETRKNALAAREWVLAAAGGRADAIARHFVAVSANVPKAVEFGIEAEQVFPMWDWVGGRYSLWSAIGLPILFAVGPAQFEALLAGARAMDSHFRSAAPEENLPVLLALLGVWYQNLWGARSHVILPYAEGLRQLPDFLQQLDMESNGKSCTRDGGPIDYPTGSVIWGTPGTIGQHSFHQLLHQGTQLIPADFIVALQPITAVDDHQDHLFANCLAQSRALMWGKTLEEAEAEMCNAGVEAREAKRLAPHRAVPGNRPSNTLLLQQLDPANLGALLALYEHKVYVQSLIWNINAFDQWGVELGKALSDAYHPLLTGTTPLPEELDASTAALIRSYRTANA